MSTPDSLQVIPLGGLGEFGLNCSVLACGDDLLVLDAGIMFPTEDFLGVNIVIPDLSFIEDRRRNVRGVVLTHGHEDHIGAFPFLAPLVDCPVYGAPLTVGFARDRLRDRAPKGRAKFVPVRDGEICEAGPFRIEFLPVTHSIPDTTALAIRTPAGLVVHSADFKLDPDPVDGRMTDLRRFAALGNEGVELLLLDSTNAPQPGFSTPERQVGMALERIFREARTRIFVTCFASNIHRLQQIIDQARSSGRRFALVGRRLTECAETAMALGRLHVPPGLRIDPPGAMVLPPHEAVIVASGSQGEPLSALMRIALGEHPEVTIERGDFAILASRPVPGNERPVARMLDHLYRRGAEVLTDRNGTLHASGHACQEELKEILRLIRPRVLVPVHGTYRHLAECARLAESASPSTESFIAETGEIIELGPGGVRVAGRAPAGRVRLDSDLETVNEDVLSARRRLSADGIVVPVLVFDRRGALASVPTIVSHGFAPLDSHDALRRELVSIVTQAVRDAGPEAASDRSVITSRVQEDLRCVLSGRTGRQPLILPVVVEV